MNETAKIINKKILDWAKEKPKLVVAIDGYTGIGKTDLIESLSKINPAILPVNRDDFGLPRKTIEGFLQKTNDWSEVFELHNTDYAKVEKLITEFRAGQTKFKTKVFNRVSGEIDIDKIFDLSKSILVIEGVFLFHPKLLNHLWDKRIYLEGDTTLADERRIQREKAKWGKDYFPEDHPDSYFRHVIIALKRYKEQYKPEQVADLVIEVV